METAIQTHQIVITVLLTLLGFASGIGVSHFGILKKLNKVVTQQAVDQTVIAELKIKEDRTFSIHEQTLGLVREVISQNNLLINQLITHSPMQTEHRR